MKNTNYSRNAFSIRLVRLCLLAVCTLCVLILPKAAYAATEYTFGDFSYKIDTGVALITKYNGNATRVEIPNTITHNGTEYKVKTISDSAFKGNTYLKEVIIPKNVTSLGSNAFTDCVNLSSLTVNGTIDSCYEGMSHNSFVNAGSNSGSITVTFGDGVTKIPDHMFDTGKAYNSGNGEYARVTKVIMSDSITTVGEGAFDGCFDLEEVEWGNGLVSIGASAFSDCRKIRIVNLSNSLAKIGDYAFNGASSISDVYYDGLQSMWTSVETGKYNDSLLNAQFHYNIAYAEVSIPDCYYNGNPQEPVAKIKDGDTLLEDGVHYEISYSDNLEKGDAKATIGGKGIYYGNIIVGFRIVEAPEETYEAVGVIEGTDVFVYNGKVHRPEVYALDCNTGEIIDDSLYSVTYNTDGKKIGRHSISISFSGIYSDSGRSRLYYKIKPAKAVISMAKPGKKSVSITVKKQGGGVRYQIRYKTGNGKWKSKTTKNNKITIKKLKKGRTYTIKVRTYKKVNGTLFYGKWSKVKRVKVR